MDVAVLLGAVAGAAAEEGFGPVSVDVPPEAWHDAVTAARDLLGCTFLDFLTAVDEGDGIRVVCHLARLDPLGHLLLRTLLPAERPRVASVHDVYAGAGWHERETAEMFGVAFTGASGEELAMPHLLLREGFDGHPLRKSFTLQAREATPWPGEREPR